MFIPKNKFKALEKRIADLEAKVQGQQEVMILHINNHEGEAQELREIFSSFAKAI